MSVCLGVVMMEKVVVLFSEELACHGERSFGYTGTRRARCGKQPVGILEKRRWEHILRKDKQRKAHEERWSIPGGRYVVDLLRS